MRGELTDGVRGVAAEAPPTVTTPETARASGRAASEAPWFDIEPPGRWRWPSFRELWGYRDLVALLTLRDIKVRYKQTVLGAAWALLQPAMLMIVFTLVFKRMANVPSSDAPYPVFVYTGLVAWGLFASGVNAAAGSVVGSERLVTKTYFPRLIVPFASIGAPILDFLVASVLLLALIAGYGVAPSWHVLLAPVVASLIALLALGVGTLFAALNVAYRDVRPVLPFLIQFGLFATPTIYLTPSYGHSAWGDFLLLANPMTPLVTAFRATILGGEVRWVALGTASLVAVLTFVGGVVYFRKVEGRFADVI
jgi:lipopolysaccharide transport system permease protein